MWSCLFIILSLLMNSSFKFWVSHISFWLKLQKRRISFMVSVFCILCGTLFDHMCRGLFQNSVVFHSVPLPLTCLQIHMLVSSNVSSLLISLSHEFFISDIIFIISRIFFGLFSIVFISLLKFPVCLHIISTFSSRPFNILKIVI